MEGLFILHPSSSTPHLAGLPQNLDLTIPSNAVPSEL